MSVSTQSISLQTQGNSAAHNITEEVAQLVGESRLTSGTATIFCPSATSALTTIEFESGCIQDLRRLFEEMVDPDRNYAHNDRWGDGNGHAHVRAALLGPSLSVPFVKGQLTLGTWQQIIFMDFDNRSRNRKLVVQIIGEQ